MPFLLGAMTYSGLLLSVPCPSLHTALDQILAADTLFRWCAVPSRASTCSAVLRCIPPCRATAAPPRPADTPSEGLKIWSSQGPVTVGWFLGRPSKLSSYLVCEEYKKAGLPPIKWWSDLYCDDVPHWRRRPGGTKDEGMLVSGHHGSPYSTILPIHCLTEPLSRLHGEIASIARVRDQLTRPVLAIQLR
jgi:hypothetical protein